MPLGHFSYFFLGFLFLWIPILVFWLIDGQLLWGYKKFLGIIMILSLLAGSYWDIYAVEHRIWNFFPDSTIGIFFAGVPLEEYVLILSAALGLGSISIVCIKRIK